jgi:hypothetical protein
MNWIGVPRQFGKMDDIGLLDAPDIARRHAQAQVLEEFSTPAMRIHAGPPYRQLPVYFARHNGCCTAKSQGNIDAPNRADVQSLAHSTWYGEKKISPALTS